MPFVDAPDTYAEAPRAFQPSRVLAEVESVQIEDGYLSISDAILGRNIDLSGCEELELTDCVLDGVSFAGVGSVRMRRCRLDTCDLTQTAVELMHSIHLAQCKLVGIHLAGAALQDVAFERCVLRYCNMRATSLARTEFTNCELNEVDFYDAALTNVAFPGSTLTKVIVDKTRFRQVDLRGAEDIELSGMSDLSGLLISPQQVIGMAYQFALASGVSIDDPQ